jgi:hypothetical protein
MRCKFKSIGQVREATEKDLILANLAMRRAIYQKENGLNETLYPNEENELLNRLTARGSLFIYDPQAMVYRSQRESLARFAHQMFSYGRGRMEHFMSAPSFFQPLFLLPLIFCLYLMSVPLVPGLWFRIPLAVYLVAGVVSSLVIAFQEKQPLALLLLPVLFPIMHVSYGIGLAWGVIKTRLKFRFQQEPPVAVKVKRVKSMAWVSQLG